MATAVWTPRAVSELEDILFYIRAVDGRAETARRIGQELCEHVDRQVRSSLSGLKHPLAPADCNYLKYKR